MSLHVTQLLLSAGHFSLRFNAILAGRITGVFGPSGAGKTSLLEAIAGLRRPNAGKIDLHGSVLVDTERGFHLPSEHRAVAYVPQDGALFPHLDVRENLLYGFRPTRARPAALTLEHVLQVLELERLIDRAPQHLSGGEKQRVALGRALLANPKLLLLDEPLAGLDAALKARVLPYLIRIRDEFAIPMIYVSHSPDEIVGLCDDVVCLEDGKLSAHATPAEIFERSPELHYRLKN